MKKMIWFISVSILCSTVSLLVKADTIFDDVSKGHQTLLTEASKNNFDCEKGFESILGQFSKLQSSVTMKDIEAAKTFLPELFLYRLKLKDIVHLDNPVCLKQMRSYFFQSRSVQDQLYILLYTNEQKTIQSVDFLKIDVPQLKEPSRSFINPKVSDSDLHPGDIMIAKGISFTSSTISRLPVQPNQFSHIALFVQHDGSLHTLESYIGKGVDAYSLNDALKNENARILILRPKNANLAKNANEMMDSIYAKSVSTNRKIKYDYKLDMKDHSELTCAEVAVTAFEKASDGRVIIPEFQSAINFSNSDFLKNMGLRNGSMMMPDDMEFDNRFDTVLEWSEFTLLQDSLRKDQIMNFILKRIDKNESILNHSYKSVALDVL
ncbi:MAG: hypothetical protein H7256_08140, partial [Bdellovibrio sp.]|nr:hypothetical protein [Bdellovibrio sp.]